MSEKNYDYRTGERVRRIRKTLGLTLEGFGGKLGVSKQTISRIENNVSCLTEQMAKLICHEYNVNYDFLVYESGEMFARINCHKNSSEDIDSFRGKLLSVLSSLDDDGWKALKSIFDSIDSKIEG